MNTLSIIIIAILSLVVIIFMVDYIFGFSAKWKDSNSLQREYDKIHEKYKDELNR